MKEAHTHLKHQRLSCSWHIFLVIPPFKNSDSKFGKTITMLKLWAKCFFFFFFFGGGGGWTCCFCNALITIHLILFCVTAVLAAILSGDKSNEVQDLLLLDVAPAVHGYRDGRRCDDRPHQEEHHHPHQENGDFHHLCGQPAGYFDSGLRRRASIDQGQRKFAPLEAIVVETSYMLLFIHILASELWFIISSRLVICMWTFVNQCWILTFILRISCRTSSESMNYLASLLHPGESPKSMCRSISMPTVSSTYQLLTRALVKRTRSPSLTTKVNKKLLMERTVNCSILVIFIGQLNMKKPSLNPWLNN